MEAGDPIDLLLLCGEAWIVHEFDEPHKTMFAKDGTVGLKIIVTIRKNETGETVVRDDWLLYSPALDGDRVSTFIWEEGNYACDCNRELFFENEHGRDFDCTRCTDGRFSVSLANKMGGRVFYSELGDGGSIWDAHGKPVEPMRVFYSEHTEEK